MIHSVNSDDSFGQRTHLTRACMQQNMSGDMWTPNMCHQSFPGRAEHGTYLGFMLPNADPSFGVNQVCVDSLWFSCAEIDGTHLYAEHK